MKVGVVTSLPDGDEHKSGIAYYSRTILEPLAGISDELVIFSDAPGETPSSNVRVVRCWRFGHLAPFQILRALLRNPVDVLHVEYDVYLYGGVVVAMLLPFVLGCFRRYRGVEVTTTLHGVVSQSTVTGGMLRQNGFVLPFSAIGRWGFTAMYRLFDWASDRLIVLEGGRAETLERDYHVPAKKISVVPLPLMHEHARPEKSEARRRCGVGGERLVLYFGYASYYKGLGTLLDAFPAARTDCESLRLKIVAGRHPRLQGNARYEAFYARLRERAGEVGAEFYDFLPESELVELLAAADVVVLPYAAAYGASAALNTAIAARRPVLVSKRIRFDGALPCQVFEPNASACAEAICAFFSQHAATLNDRTEALAESRDVTVISHAIHNVRCGRPQVRAIVRSHAPIAAIRGAVDAGNAVAVPEGARE
jgi:glycosyltransferase involved in cell wall biosynthesis